MLGSSSTALYVSFIGTKEARDLLADANILQGALWQDSTSPSPAAVLSFALLFTYNLPALPTALPSAVLLACNIEMQAHHEHIVDVPLLGSRAAAKGRRGT